MEAISIRESSSYIVTPAPLTIQFFLTQPAQWLHAQPIDTLNTALLNVTSHTYHWKKLQEACPPKKVIELAQYIFKTIYSKQKPLKPFEHLSVKNEVELTTEQELSVKWANHFLESQHIYPALSCFQAGFDKLFMECWNQTPILPSFPTKEGYYFHQAVIAFINYPTVEGFREIAKKLYDKRNTLPSEKFGWNLFCWNAFLIEDVEDLAGRILANPSEIASLANIQKDKDNPLKVAQAFGNPKLALRVIEKNFERNAADEKRLSIISQLTPMRPEVYFRLYPEDIPKREEPRNPLPLIIIIGALLTFSLTGIIYHIIREIHRQRSSLLKA